MSSTTQARSFNKDDLTRILWGATLLGSGGGGSFQTGLQLLESLPADWRVAVVDVPTAAADARAISAVVAEMGSPQAMNEMHDVNEALTALARLQEVNGGLPPIRYIAPVEIGALSTLLACIVAAQCQAAVVDCDGAGRAVPTLTLTTYGACAELDRSAAVLADSDKASLVIKANNAAEVESICRPILGAPGSPFAEKAGIALWPMDGQTLLKAAPIRGTLGLCLAIGDVLLRTPAQERVAALLAELARQGLRAKILARGYVSSLGKSTSGGFDFGKLMFFDDSGDTPAVTYTYNQNENLLAWDGSRNQALASAPDSICFISENGHPFTNADVGATLDGETILGSRSLLIGIEAHPALSGNARIMQAVYSSLMNVSYAGPHVPLDFASLAG